MNLLNDLSKRYLLLLASTALLLSCGATIEMEGEAGVDPIGGDAETGNTGDTDGGDPGEGPGDTGVPPLTAEEDDGCDQIDLLFVIDDSGSMGEEQSNLSVNFPAFADVIQRFQTSTGDAIDYRLGVTTTGVSVRIRRDLAFGITIDDDQRGADGALVNGSCSGETRPWLERNDGDIANKFSCMADVGTSGPDEEMPLEAIRRSIEDRVEDGVNTDFFREDALLGIVVLTDEDDCSTQEARVNLGFGDDICDDAHVVDDYVAALDGFKGERGKWATAVIAGLDNCNSALGSARRATRLLDFSEQTGENAITSSICEGDLASALQDALETFDAACRSFPPIE